MVRPGVVALVLAPLALAAACADPAVPPAPIDLRAATGRADVVPTGVAVDPTGARYVFDEASGLYRFGDDGALDLVLARDAMPDPGVPVRAPFTDLVAIGRGRFAITALGEGFLLDLGLASMQPYFCYVPDGLPEDYDQRTDAVTYDEDAGLLYAQPRTFDAAGNLLASQVASYAFQTGEDLEWRTLAGDVASGGMAKVPDVDGLLVAVGSGLRELHGYELTETIDLAPLGVVRIDGLAVDRVARTLLVLDGEADRLHELALADVLRAGR